MKRIVLLLISISFLHGIPVSTHAQEGYALNLVGRLNTGITYDVHVDGNNAYLTNNRGVDILDVSDISNPRKISTIQIQDGAFGIYVEDGVAYIAGETGLTIADVSDPEHPEILGSFYDGGVNRNVRIRGSYAYVTDYEDGLEIVDISDPSNPVMIGCHDLDDTRGVEVVGDIAYVTAPRIGLRVLNISNPAEPRIIRSVPGTGSAESICVHDDRIYLGCSGQGVRIASITDPLNPRVTGDFSAGIREASGVYGDEDLLLVVDQTGGGDVVLLDVSDLEAPRVLARYTNLNAHDVFYDGDFGYIATVNKGMYILEYGPERTGNSTEGQDNESSRTGIPGFPLPSIILSMVLIMILLAGMSRRSKKTFFMSLISLCAVYTKHQINAKKSGVMFKLGGGITFT